MDKNDVRLMIVSTKQCKDWTGENAYYVPNGKCTNSLNYATELWCQEFDIKYTLL